MESNTSKVCGLFEALETILDDSCILSPIIYKGALAWLVESEAGKVRIVWDSKNEFKSAQGVHTTLLVNEYELRDKLESAFHDGFNTIFIHNSKEN